MPHNPRRQRVVQPPDSGLTTERIAAAMERARELRRRTACDPGDVRCVPMAPADVASRAKGRRLHMPWTDEAPRHDPWCLVGWLRHERIWGFTDPLGRDRYDQTWEVWLNLDDERVWLKLGRWCRRAKDDPYP